MEFGPRPGKEQDFGINRINCPYFVPSGWVARHVLRYCLASSGIKGRRRLDYTINWTLGTPCDMVHID
ncbi:Cytochrome c oxidase subunit 8B, mitochondrial [Gossypium arboreum]|uniref:Cytochrome c oxidase subunit 8B, mitochondrial n=1 Tax=Gossypium arboreum TaxID=29729 RepID=A0A0B0NRD4_GOSAR|nr:Cytochrome c oxidase subunit 8B, mitochondrial [Gossypium arboreum]